MERFPEQAQSLVALLEFLPLWFIQIKPRQDRHDRVPVSALRKLCEQFHLPLHLELELLAQPRERERNFAQFVLVEVQRVFQFRE